MRNYGHGYRVEDSNSKIDFELNKPEGHLVLEVLESKSETVDGVVIPRELVYAVRCTCQKHHPIENNEIQWNKEFNPNWDPNEL